MYRSGIERKKEVVVDPKKDNYIPPSNTIELDSDEQINYVNNELLIIFNSSVTDDQIADVVDYLDGEIVGTVPEINMYQVLLPDAKSLVQLESIADDLTTKYSFISYATYDTATPGSNDDYVPDDPWENDTDFNDWKDSDVGGSNWWAEAIDAKDAWEQNDSLEYITVGVCDSSFDVKHEDLKNKIEFPNELLKARNITTPWWNDFDFKTWEIKHQENYHGTHVAGIIGAEADNKKGITGLVKKGKLLIAPYREDENINEYYRYDSSTYANLAYLVKSGAKVINFSQGKTNWLNINKMSYSQAFLTREGNLAAVCITKLLEEKEKYGDFIVVQSAGNGLHGTNFAVDAIQNGWFASITENSITGSDRVTISDVLGRVIIVGAAEQDGRGYRCTDFSNYGDQVSIFAPGRDIYSTMPGDCFWHFQFSGSYGYENGTSMAAPIVTGICALTWAADPDLSGPEVKDIVCHNTASKVQTSPATQDVKTYELVNAKLSVEAALKHRQETGGDKAGGGGAISDCDNVSLNSMFNPIFSYIIARDFADRNNRKLTQDSEVFWKMVALYATREAYRETDSGEERLAELYESDETMTVVSITEDAAVDFINAVLPDIKTWPDLPPSKQDEIYWFKNGVYYLPIIDVYRDGCRVKSGVAKKDGNVEAVVEIYSTGVDFVSVVYKLEMIENNRINTNSPEPYKYCIKSAVILDEPSKEYLELIEEYRSAFKEYELLGQDLDTFADKYPLISTYAVRQLNIGEDITLCSGYKDINGDGEYELVLSIAGGDWQNVWFKVCSIYTRYDKKVIPLLKDLGDMTDTTIYDDGMIRVREQGSHGKETLYRIREDGRGIALIAQYETDWENHPDFPYSDGKNRLSSQQFEEKYISNRKEQELEWKDQVYSWEE